MLSFTTSKQFVTTRGLMYNYRYAPSQAGKPTLLLIHGFPSTSFDWRHQIAFFVAKGYGIVAPDMLGYGETEKPSDPLAYRGSLMARDLVDILDAEKAERVIAIGHDWGASTTSYLEAQHQDRFIGFTNMAAGFMLCRGFKLEEMLSMYKQMFGQDMMGYWAFFDKNEAAGITEKNLDSLYDLAFPKDIEYFKTIIHPIGATDAFIGEGKRLTSADYLAEEDRELFRESFSKGGLTGPLNWYKVASRGLQDTDGLELSNDKVKITKPVLYIGGQQDCVCKPEMQKPDMEKICEDLQFEVFDCDYWIQLALPDRVNATVEKWIEAKGLSGRA
ncbi:Alpha/Beta hydrolase protein [Schizophyllum amplum]|uniref:Alpha/Beta hydrolase protein n=1 Tax=Schizophyllum amplum TaxID=97359 RepID=A0A550CIG8_9AGAR|nr:Alpha/Beta hydrolase protein [Auriculariopsis ampla]